MQITRRTLIATLATAAALPLAACGAGGSTAAPAATATGQTVGGHLTLIDTNAVVLSQGEPCSGTGGFDDLHEGATVRIATDAGTTLALGALGQGLTVSDPSGFRPCRFSFAVPNVPLGTGEFFIVEVTHRGQTRVPRAHLEGSTVELTIG